MPCGHNICQECVVAVDSEGLEMQCYYDNCVVKSLGDELVPNQELILRIQVQNEMQQPSQKPKKKKKKKKRSGREKSS